MKWEKMSAKARVLIADDEPHIRRILQFLLENYGFEVHQAEDGVQALEAVRTWQPDLVLLDVMMPHMDGFAVLEKIRDNFETANIPVIMLTAKGEVSDKVEGLRGGANDYMIKPFDQDELLLRVSNLLSSSKREREANPLTGLPGNQAIERETVNRIHSLEDFGFMYIDIDRFKSFNDYYGFRKGDDAISFLSHLLVQCSRDFGSERDFIGHVGGDDFVMITEPWCAENLGRKIIEAFDRGVVALHEPEDAEKGFLQVEGRGGEITRFPLITLTVALVTDAKNRFLHPAQLSDTMAELKRYGKTMNSSVLVLERRDSNGQNEFIVPQTVSVGFSDDENS
jgi:PleD family two-component response regulator